MIKKIKNLEWTLYLVLDREVSGALILLHWNGEVWCNTKPLALGKGVCFDTGGYSLKPAKFMEDMTYDMAGSATVVGLRKILL